MIEETRYVLLTGASRGIGHATVKLFQERGWRVFTVSRQPFSVECRWVDAKESHLQADLSDLKGLRNLVEMVRQKLPEGKLHALVNNAGISPKGEGGKRLGVLDTDEFTWVNVLRVNLVATALLSSYLFPELKKARGSIVNVTSIAGSRVHPFAGAAYAASKAGLTALTREQAHEFAPQGVRVNAIAPGEINTSILSPDTHKIVETQIPMHRLGTPHEVAQAIYYLCSEQSSYINGSELQINGGQHV